MVNVDVLTKLMGAKITDVYYSPDVDKWVVDIMTKDGKGASIIVYEFDGEYLE